MLPSAADNCSTPAAPSNRPSLHRLGRSSDRSLLPAESAQSLYKNLPRSTGSSGGGLSGRAGKPRHSRCGVLSVAFFLLGSTSTAVFQISRWKFHPVPYKDVAGLAIVLRAPKLRASGDID